MTYQEPRVTGRFVERARSVTAARIILLAAGLSSTCRAAEPKSDFRGLRTGMTVAQAEAAASRNGMTCETSFTGQTACRGDGSSVALTTTGRKTNLIWELQVTLAGHFETAAMRAELDGFYGLTATSTPSVYVTASGQELLLLEIVETSTIFYLRDPKVLKADPQPLPPPKL